MAESRALADLLGSLVRLREALEEVPLGLTGGAVEAARRTRGQVVAQLEDYVLPRLMQLDAPLLTVVGGSTGAGKSTLINSLLGTAVTPVGTLRPTTRSPVLVHHPDDGHWFEGDRVLPNLSRSERQSGAAAVRLVSSDRLTRGIALLDAPDIDSVDQANRALAEEILAAADLWLFVTTAARYADLVPWEVLGDAARRSTAVAVVLDRTDPDDLVEVQGHLARMMSARGLRDSPLFVVPECDLDADGLLPAGHVGDVHRWLSTLATDLAGRGSIVEQSLLGTLRTIVHGSHQVADVTAEQAAAADRLRRVADEIADTVSTEAVAAVGDGRLARGAVVSRWQELAASGDADRWAGGRTHRVRRRLVGGLRADRGGPAERLERALTDTVVAHVLDAVNTVADRVSTAWSGDAAAAGLLDAATEGRAGRGRARRDRVEAAVTDWQTAVGKAVAEAGRIVPQRDDTGEAQAGLTAVAEVAALAAAARTEPAASAADQTRGWLEEAIGTGAAGLVETARTELAVTVRQVIEAERDSRRAELSRAGGSVHDAERIRAAARVVDDLRPSGADL